MTEQIGVQLMYSGVVMAACALVHGVMILLARVLFQRREDPDGSFGSIFSDTIRLILIAMWLFLAHAVSIALWAVLYYQVGVSPLPEEALYLALTCYTTLGFGDVLAPVDWRLLTGTASMTGLLLFGLSAAILIETAERLKTRGRRH